MRDIARKANVLIEARIDGDVAPRQCRWGISVHVALAVGAPLMPAAPAISGAVVSSAASSDSLIATNADAGEQGLRNLRFAAVRKLDIANRALMSDVITFIHDPAPG